MPRRPAFLPLSRRSSRFRRALSGLLPVLVVLGVAAAPAAMAAKTAKPAGSSTTTTTTKKATTTTKPPTTTTTAPASGATTSSTVPVACPTPVPNPVSVDPAAEEEPPAATTPAVKALAAWGTAPSDNKRAERVNALVTVGGIAYLGGEFTGMVAPGGKTPTGRAYLAAVDGGTGKLTSWNPKASGKVWALELATDQKSVYAGGDFSYIGGKSVSKLARIDLATGKLDTNFKPKSVKGRVRALALAGDILYVGGEFTSIDGQVRPKLAALDARTGALLPWMPPVLGPGRYLTNVGTPSPGYDAGHVFAVEAFDGRVFAGGTFLNLGCRAGLVSLDAATGAPTTTQFEPERPIFDLDNAGGILYAVGGGPGGRLFALDPEEKWPNWKIKFDGDAVGVTVSAGTVYVAGHYDHIVNKDSSCYQFCPEGTGRRHLSAFNLDGKLQAWNPTADTSTGPYVVAAGADALFVGGEFNSVNSKPQPGFAVFPGTP